jgi:hypothetical protein
MELAFVTIERAVMPEPDRVVASAEALGLTMSCTDREAQSQTYEVDGATMIVSLMPAPHPDAPTMPVGPTSPTTEESTAARAHLMVVVMRPDEAPALQVDTEVAALLSTVIDHVPAVGAMLAHGVVFHKARLYADMAKLGHEHGALPVEVAVDVTAARESAERMSFLTHGLARYGREELYVSCPIQGKGALDFIYGLARWMLSDPDRQFPDGDTVGRTAEEKIRIARVPNPRGEGSPVIKLDLP